MLLYWGEQVTSGGYAWVLSGFGPILTVVFAYFILRSERMTPRALPGVAVGFVGILVRVPPSLFGSVGSNWMGPVEIAGAFVVFPLGIVLLFVGLTDFSRWFNATPVPSAVTQDRAA